MTRRFHAAPRSRPDPLPTGTDDAPGRVDEGDDESEGEGEEGALVAYEMEYRCVACDRGVCACCVVVRERDLLFCPECDR
ncbi:MAG TPA: hypothetical protein VMN78_12125 [Longimicrobiales bacterium]|nr:hypothetical protein [Longimicrobiales bacterium]